jgi:nucleoside-diphosphate-sugar epimerase
MVVGNGLMAKRFSAYQSSPEVVIFASGVSDSKSTDEAAFEREFQMVEHTLSLYPDSLFVYFSTCSIYDPSLSARSYIIHKLKVEERIAASGVPYMIFRVSNVAGPGGNPKTIFHFLAKAVKEGLPFELWMHAYRNLVDVDDVFALVKYLVEHGRKNAVYNIANPASFHLPEMVRVMEHYFHQKARYGRVEAGDFFHIDTSLVEEIAAAAGVDFDGDYLRRLLLKYYPQHDLPTGSN